ncbi:MAG: SAM-dependent methyltransferase [Dermatophilus congolensis]|nr:SAM-dependent methyltransferase [Dermatophilus congolensis]
MSITPDFEEMYQADPDPWEVGTSWYERRKTALVLATLRRERYRLAWDPACGTGDLAVGLAGRCERLVCSDLSETACDLTSALLREAEVPLVASGSAAAMLAGGPMQGTIASVERCALPDRPEALGDEKPDLIVLSEFLYYLDDDQRARTWQLLDEVCHETTDIVAVHWTPEPEQAHLSGSAAQRELNAHLGERGWWRLVTHTDIEFVVALWSKDAPTHIGR